MLRLNIAQKPEWLDLGHGVRVKVSPMTTALMIAARNDPAVRDLPEDTSDEERSLVFSKALARRAIEAWEGVGDSDGKPADPSPAAIDALIEFYPCFEAFQEQYMAKGMTLDAEKNASAPLPNGITAGANGTAPAAKKPARNARTKRTARKR